MIVDRFDQERTTLSMPMVIETEASIRQERDLVANAVEILKEILNNPFASSYVLKEEINRRVVEPLDGLRFRPRESLISERAELARLRLDRKRLLDEIDRAEYPISGEGSIETRRLRIIVGDGDRDEEGLQAWSAV